MAHYGREEIGVAIPNGSGYIGTLNMYHELHCIVSCQCHQLGLESLLRKLFQKRIHQYMYQDYYFKSITPQQKEMNRLHNGKPLTFPPSVLLI